MFLFMVLPSGFVEGYPVRARRSATKFLNQLWLLSPGVQDLRARSGPDAGVAHEVRERGLERADAVRLADGPRVQRDAHDAAALRPGFLVKKVELVDELVAQLVLVVVHA